MRVNFIPAIIVGILSFSVFRWCYLRCSTVLARIILVTLGLVAAIPALLFASNYMLYMPYANWFYTLHAMPGAEITSGLVTAILGIIYASARLRPTKLNIAILFVSTCLSFGLLLTPFTKQLFWPADYDTLTNSWKDGVCLQTSRCTCVPACVATYLSLQGEHLTEPQLARAAGTTKTGTEYWYLDRALKGMGFQLKRSGIRSIRTAPVPSIIGISLGDTGHVVVLLGRDKDGATIAEPLRGRYHYSWRTMERCYKSDGTCITIKRVDGHNAR